MTTSRQDEYRRNAEHAQDMAERVSSAEDKASWLKVAAGWLSLLKQRPPSANGHRGKGRFDDQAQALRSRQPDSRRPH